jgi:hypothetical protein
MPRPRRTPAGLRALLLAPLLLAGCASLHDPAHALEARHKPSNVYASASHLSPQIRRLAVLPLVAGPGGVYTECGVDSLQPVLRAELAKTRKFELVMVTPEELGDWTGRAAWSADGPLPEDLLNKVRELTGCDAVLFSQLTEYQPYQPVTVGWKLSLVQNTGGRVCWAADEVFDGGDRAVANSAMDYAWGHFQGQDGVSDPSLILSSPTRFGEYCLSALLATLPAR